MATPETHAGPGPGTEVPLWMRKGTLWTLLALATAALALVAYYLLPLWWAKLVHVWVRASNVWVTGICLGFVLVAVGALAMRGAWRRDTRQPEGRILHYVRPVLSVVTAACLVATLLTIFIALGLTGPLREAREFWHTDAPGVLAATLVGALLAIILLLAIGLIASRRQGHRKAPETEGGSQPDSPEDDVAEGHGELPPAAGEAGEREL